MMEVVHQITIMYKYKEIYKRIKEKHGAVGRYTQKSPGTIPT